MFFRIMYSAIAIGLSGIFLFAQAQEDLAWKASSSLQKAQRLEVVDNVEKWKKLWRETLNQEAPKVDFKQYNVACVFLGDSVGWLYEIHIDKGIVENTMFVINYSLQPMIMELKGPYQAQGQYKMQVFAKQPLKTVIRYAPQSGDLQ